MIVSLQRKAKSRPSPSRRWTRTFVLARFGRIEGQARYSLLLLGWFEWRISSTWGGKVWRAAR